jgi:hypothetical protein
LNLENLEMQSNAETAILAQQAARPARGARRLRAARRIYVWLSVSLLNSFLVFALLNFLLWPLLVARESWRRAHVPPPIEVVDTYGALIPQIYAQDHPGWSPADVQQLISETWLRPYAHERYLEWRERPFHGRFVNVDANGFRLGLNQGPWPPDPAKFNVFVFGGSTTFGYGVTDSETIPSNLQQLLAAASKRDVRVYNFGQGGYQSVPERILFERLLGLGYVPRAAVFIDGLNEFYDLGDMPGPDRALADVMDGKFPPGPSVIKELPLVRATEFVGRGLRSALGRSVQARAPYDDWHTDAWKDALDPNIADPAIARVIARYRNSKRMIEAVGDAYHVPVAFVWQPVSAYKYDLRYLPFFRPSEGWTHLSLVKKAYPEAARLAGQRSFGGDFLWCADIQQDAQERLYVDMVHYSVKLNRMAAGCIADQAVQRNLIPF